MNDQVLEIMKEIGKPCAVSDVVKKSGLDKAVVDKAFKALKKEGRIVSPVRCKWEPAA